MKKTLKSGLACLLCVFGILSILPITSYASNNAENEIIIIDTGDSEIGIEIYKSEIIETRAYSTTTRSHSGRFYLKSDSSKTLANFKTTGTFNYDGSICNVVDCVNSVSNVADGWEVDDKESEKQVSATLAKAVGEFYLYNENSGLLATSATITISCNQNGKTNTEFNGGEEF